MGEDAEDEFAALVDAAGLVLLAHAHAANLHDRLGVQALVDGVGSGELPRVEPVWADGAYAGTFARWLQVERGWCVEVTKHRNRRLWRYGLEGSGYCPERRRASIPRRLGRTDIRLAVAAAPPRARL